MGEIKLKDLLKHRSIAMTMAILLVMIYHSRLSFGSYIIYFATTFLFLGVDVFMFTTGIGSYYSLKKSTYSEYLKKRVLRIAIPYVIFMLLWCPYAYIYKHVGIDGVIGNIFGVEWLLNMDKSFNWYITSIIIFYPLMPILMKIADKLKMPWGILLAFAVSLLFIRNTSLIIISSRLPILLLGVYTAKYSLEDKSISYRMIALLLIMMVIGIVAAVYLNISVDGLMLWNYGLYWYPYFIIVPGLCISIALISEKIEETSLYHFLNGLGSYTFEVYLIHIMLFDVQSKIIGSFGSSLGLREASSLLIIATSFVLGKYYKMFTDNVRSKLANG